jgi:peroxiredoxin Q/BCP
LLADTAGEVSARYGSLRSILGKKLSSRNTFLIDPEGKVARVYLGVKPAKHSEEVLADLAGFRKP